MIFQEVQDLHPGWMLILVFLVGSPINSKSTLIIIHSGSNFDLAILSLFLSSLNLSMIARLSSLSFWCWCKRDFLSHCGTQYWYCVFTVFLCA